MSAENPAVPSCDPRLIVALDHSGVDEARALVQLLGDRVSFYKVGLTLLAAGGVSFARELGLLGKQVFQDWKLHDIGAQVEGAAMAIASGGCDLLTVHAEPQVMRAAVRGRDQGGPGTRILAVTVLTSLSQDDLREIGYDMSPETLVERRVAQAIDCGVDGVVASPLEAARVRQIALDKGRADFLIVTPGVRPEGSDADDQRRIATPQSALGSGATHLVVGRPITAARDPRAAAAAVIEDMGTAR